ncbi:hypothetical protein J7M02_01240 [Candidatus Aerophobetes bacterium]|nr:hypothetical protein [Candidatus Aerophobetes bacterium]
MRKLYLNKNAKKILWDREEVSESIFIERAIQYGPEDLIRKLEKKLGREKIVSVLKKSRSLSKRVVNYWCLIYNIEPNDTYAFSSEREGVTIWEPFL